MEIIGATRATRDEMTFYDMWLAGVMLAGICGRFGKAGIFSKLGAFFFFLFESPEQKGRDRVGRCMLTLISSLTLKLNRHSATTQYRARRRSLATNYPPFGPLGGGGIVRRQS